MMSSLNNIKEVKINVHVIIYGCNFNYRFGFDLESSSGQEKCILLLKAHSFLIVCSYA